MIKLYTSRHTLLTLTSLIALGTLSGLAKAQEQDMPTLADEEAALTTTLEDLPDQSPLVLTGIVGDVRHDEFDMNYGADSPITVELDRFDWSDNATDYLSPGEKVTIHGFIDDDIFEGREVEAYDVHIHERSTYYRTSESPQENTSVVNGVALEDGAYITVTGTVSEVSAAKFDIVTSGGGKFMVDAKDLEPPLRLTDGTYFVAPGDRVNIRGNFDMRYYQNKTIYADRVIKLVDSGINPVIED